MKLITRQASEQDVEGIFQLIQEYADKGIMLPRSRDAIARLIPDFAVTVMEHDGEVAGCGSLCQLGKDLVEIRSLGVKENFQGRGIGKQLLDHLVAEANRRGLRKVMALTYQTPFFERNGFSVVSKEIFPEKVWTDCIYCKKQNHCDEIAVLKKL